MFILAFGLDSHTKSKRRITMEKLNSTTQRQKVKHLSFKEMVIIQTSLYDYLYLILVKSLNEYGNFIFLIVLSLSLEITRYCFNLFVKFKLKSFNSAIDI